MAIRVLLIDSQPLYVAGMVAVLSQDDRFVLVGTASNAGAGLTLARQKSPDVVILDIDMPIAPGFITGPAVIGKLLEAVQGKVIVLTAMRDDEALRHSFNAGAMAYLLKDIDEQELCEMILAVMRGKQLISSGVSFVTPSKSARRVRASREASPQALTLREKQILSMVAAGSNSREISRDLNISARTVETHRYRLMRKFRVSNAAGLIRQAARSGHLEP